MHTDTHARQFPLAALRRGAFRALCGLLVVLSLVLLFVLSERGLFHPRPCDPAAQAPANQRLLGQPPGQRYLGSVWIDFTASDQEPASFSYGADSAAGPAQVLQPALAALQDPAQAMQPLPYAALGLSITAPGQRCLLPDPAERGYIVVEVWDGQVNLGYGGAALRTQAAAVVAGALEPRH